MKNKSIFEFLKEATSVTEYAEGNYKVFVFPQRTIRIPYTVCPHCKNLLEVDKSRKTIEINTKTGEEKYWDWN